jgi:aspartyl-tRNA(Asn)/glutamyl-tRNA(Gln) amidotransferase subunit A
VRVRLDYVDMMQARTHLVRSMDQRLAAFDAVLMPTTPIVVPTLAEVADSKDYAVRNTLVLRNTSIGNFFNLCGVSLPLKAKLPVGLMLMARKRP